MNQDVVLTVADADLSILEGRLFQAHVLPGNRLRLYPVTLVHDARCPVIVKGERCGCKAGHDGKHWWGNGD